MLSVSIKVDTSHAFRVLRHQQQQIPFAIAKALTLTAVKVKEAEIREMRDVFDRPTPYTLRSLFLKPATKQQLHAYVWLKDDRAGSGTPATRYLLPQIKGGTRNPKRFEIALRRAGVLPAGMIAVPASGAKFDAYGNMSKGQIVQILSYFRTFRLAGFTANITDEGRAKLKRGTRTKQGISYFVGRPAGGKLPLGIWQRTHFAVGTAIKPLLLFVDEVHYKPRFNFNYVAQRTIEREFKPALAASVAGALATAR